MSRAPLVLGKPEHAFPRGNQTVYDTTLGWRFPNPKMEEMFPLESMGETGENVAERYGVAREDQDAFALQSQQRWAAANEAGRFDDELVAVGDVTRDEHPRPDTNAEKLAALKPAFRRDGSVTAGNSSGINDGAAALVSRVRSARPSSGSSRSEPSSEARWRASTRASWGSARSRPCASCSTGPASASRISTWSS